MPFVYDKRPVITPVLVSVICDRCGAEIRNNTFASLTITGQEESETSVYCYDCYQQIISGNKYEVMSKELLSL